MNILTIPLRNMRKRWVKTVLLLVVFTLGVASIAALVQVSRVVGENLERKLTAYGANVLIQPRSEKITVSYGGLSLGDMFYDQAYLDVEASLRAIDGIRLRGNVSVVAPKLVTAALVNETHAPLVGVDFAREKLLKGYWAVSGQYPAGDGQVLLGSGLAARAGLGPGETFSLSGRRIGVAGVLAPTGGDDDNAAFSSLALAQDLAEKPGQANLIEVAALCSGCPIGEIVDELAAALPGVEVKALRQVVEQRMYSVHFVQNLALSVSVIILVTACAMVGLSMLSSVNERIREIGILRSLGFSRGHIFAIFSSEALFIGALAGLLGYAAGHIAGIRVLAALHALEAAPPDFSLTGLAATVAAVSALSVLSSMDPDWKASRVEPSQALIAL